MGIKGLFKIIERYAGNHAVRSCHISKFKGWTVSIDASLLIYQTVLAIRSDGKDITNAKGDMTSHIHGIFYKVLRFLEYGITPIFVFDSKPSSKKNKTIEQRKKRKLLAEENLKGLDDPTDKEYIKNFKQSFSIKPEYITEAKILLDLMGIPYIVAPEEADVICSWLSCRTDQNGKKYAKGVCSEDSDMLPLGSPYLFRNMLKFLDPTKPIKVISLERTLNKMDLSMNQFIDMCVLMGTDYCDNIERIGPVKSYNLITKCKTLKKTFKHLEESNEINEDVISDMFLARTYFKTALDEIDKMDFVPTEDQLKLRQFQSNELFDFMCMKHNFKWDRIQESITKLEIYYRNLNITRENNSKVHVILQPATSGYELGFSSDEEEDEEYKKVVNNTKQKSKPKTKQKPKKLINQI